MTLEFLVEFEQATPGRRVPGFAFAQTGLVGRLSMSNEQVGACGEIFLYLFKI